MVWKKGQSGNPSGRPIQSKPVRDLARTYTEDAIRTLVECLSDPNGRTRVAAATELLNRAWGKPVQAVDVGSSGEIGAGLKEIKISFVEPEGFDAGNPSRSGAV